MALDDDPWIADSVADPAKLHALGTISVWWNLCEYQLHYLFEACGSFPNEIAWAITHDLKDVMLSEKILQICIKKRLPNVIMAAVKDGLKAYDQCRINRNQLTHFNLHWENDEDSYPRFHRMKGPNAVRIEIDDSLETMRRVARDIQAVSMHLVFVRHDIECFLIRGLPPASRKKLHVPASIAILPPPKSQEQLRRPKSLRMESPSQDE